MNCNQPPSAAQEVERVVWWDVAAVGRARVPIESLPELRRRPGPIVGDSLPTTFLKNADEQTVVGLTAVHQAIADHGLEPASFDRWGVIAAPHQIGRTALGHALPRYREEGAWGMSPHLIPHRSLHGVSGAISCALKIHGPNFGVGDGPSEGLLAALAMLEHQRINGVWLVMTAFDPTLVPDCSGLPPAGTCVIGLALALVPGSREKPGLRLRVDHLPLIGPAVARRTRLDLFRLDCLLGTPVDGPRGAPLQDLGQWGKLELWVEGQLAAGRCDPQHSPPVQVPHVAEHRLAPFTFSVGAEAAR